jgi:hypothetical protein
MLFKDEASKLTFLVQGSAQEPYEVNFLKHNDNLNAYCTCPAGVLGQFCKHKFNILEGSTKAVVSYNAGEVEVVATWLAGSDVETALIALYEVQFELSKLKKKLSLARKEVARVMRE